MNPFDTNANWLSEIYLSLTHFNLLERTLATNLYIMLQSAMGFQSIIEFSTSLLGTSAILVNLRVEGNVPVDNHEQHSW